MEAFAELGFCCAWLLPHRGPAKIVSVRLNPSHGTIFVRVVCDFLSSVSSQQKFEVMEGPVLELHVIALRYLTDHVVAFRQVSVTAPCYTSIVFRK